MVCDPARSLRHVLVVDLDDAAGHSLTQLTGWRVTLARSTSGELLTVYRETDPAAVVMAVSAFHGHGPSLLQVRRRPIVCAGADDWSAARGALDAGASDWLVLPTTASHLAAHVEAAIRSFDRIETLAAEKQLLAHTLETRKLVDRAKSIFMRRLNLDEPTAHKRLQQESQNRRIAIGELARRIIDSDDILGERPMVEN